MDPIDRLPNFNLEPKDDISRQFLERGATDYHAAARLVWHLPYGRPSDRGDFRLVLTEGVGTCSTKHALLAQLARNYGADVELVLGVFEMSADNVPPLAAFLRDAPIRSFPEAHCYLSYDGVRIDLTHPSTKDARLDILYEETIHPDQIATYKEAMHRRYVARWVTENGLEGQVTPEEVWNFREKCIAGLSGMSARER